LGISRDKLDKLLSGIRQVPVMPLLMERNGLMTQWFSMVLWITLCMTQILLVSLTITL